MSKKHRIGKRAVLIGGAPGGNYLKPALEIGWTLKDLGRRVSIIDVRHDDWCGIFKGTPCDCQPELEMKAI